MKFSSLTQALAYRTTCLDCQQPFIFDACFGSFISTEIHQNKNTSLILPYVLNYWPMSSKSTTYSFILSIDLLTNFFSIDFNDYPTKVPLFLITNYLNKIRETQSLKISSNCCSSGHWINLILNHQTNQLENIQLINEYRDLLDNHIINIDHTQMCATVYHKDNRINIPNFSYSITDPDLLDIIKTSMILG